MTIKSTDLNEKVVITIDNLRNSNFCVIYLLIHFRETLLQLENFYELFFSKY